MNRSGRDLLSKLPPSSKERIFKFLNFVKPQHLIFIATFGAVPNDEVIPIITKFREPNEKSQVKLNSLCIAIEQANKKMLWPVRPKLRFIEGMSGQSFRYVLNKLISFGDGYLEIGTWRGSTACSALNGNQIDAWLIDDWSEFGGPATSALSNISKFVSKRSRLSIVSQDFKLVDYKATITNEVNVYLFDGPHSQSDHVEGVKVINSLDFETLMFVVDDWNWKDVQIGTLAGLEQLDAELIYKIEIFPKSTRRFQYSRWHNGYCFLILENTKTGSI